MAPKRHLGMLRKLKASLEEAWFRRKLMPAGKAELKRDRRGLHPADPGIPKTLEACMAWIGRAQDRSASADGGVARAYHLVKGWSTSYPETTGYIIPTFLDYARRTGSEEPRQRARRMLDWLRSIQLPGGGFQGGRVDSVPVVPVVFNTGQILLGLSSGAEVFGEFREDAMRAADWLVSIQDADGCWRKHASPFAGAGEKVYDTHTAWGLLAADRVLRGRGYGKAALANVDWALTQQSANGWFAKCCLSDPSAPLTHALGYALRGVMEAYRHSGEARYLEAARRTADGLMGAMDGEGFLPGRLRPDWSGASTWACLTGTAQIAICWMMLFEDTGERRYLEAARSANRYVRRTVSFDVPPDMAGGVKGSFPLDGEYSKYEYPNWAAKFLIDSLLLESDLAG